MNRWKLLLFAPLLCIAPLVAACGDDDDGVGGDKPDTGLTDGPGPGDGPEPTDGGKDGDSSVDLTSFPKYVKSLIELKTDNTGLPDKEAVWGTIPDDDKFVFPTTFFP